MTIGTNYRLFDFHDCVTSTENPETSKLWNTRGLRQDPAGCDHELLESQMIKAALGMQRREPKLGAFLLECTGYQPFARAVQVATGVPVFSWSAVAHRDFHGHV